MVLAFNIGNTNFAAAINTIKNTFRYPAISIKSCSDFIDIVKCIQKESGLSPDNIDGVIISSVNPSLTDYLVEAVNKLYMVNPLIVNASMKMSINLSAYDTSLIGGDRIAVCEAAYVKYGAPAIVFDLGTATTINIIDRKGNFIGGSILPGVAMGMNALSKNTSLLPLGKLTPQATLIGHNTQQCLISGAVFGNAAMIDGMAERIQAYLGEKGVVLLTGGNSSYIAPMCKAELIHDPDLLIEGLFSLWIQHS